MTPENRERSTQGPGWALELRLAGVLVGRMRLGARNLFRHDEGVATERRRRATKTLGPYDGRLKGREGRRHTWASRLTMAGVDPRTIMALGGWSNLGMLARYSHLTPGHLQAAVEKLVALGARLALA